MEDRILEAVQWAMTRWMRSTIQRLSKQAWYSDSQIVWEIIDGPRPGDLVNIEEDRQVAIDLLDSLMEEAGWRFDRHLNRWRHSS